MATSDPGDRTSNTENTFLATFEMLEFRKGNLDQGRKLYLDSIDLARRRRQKEDAVRAQFHLAFEEIRAGSDRVQEALHRLEHTEDRNEVSETPRHLKRISELLGGTNEPAV